MEKEIAYNDYEPLFNICIFNKIFTVIYSNENRSFLYIHITLCNIYVTQLIN